MAINRIQEMLQNSGRLDYPLDTENNSGGYAATLMRKILPMLNELQFLMGDKQKFQEKIINLQREFNRNKNLEVLKKYFLTLALKILSGELSFNELQENDQKFMSAFYTTAHYFESDEKDSNLSNLAKELETAISDFLIENYGSEIALKIRELAVRSGIAMSLDYQSLLHDKEIKSSIIGSIVIMAMPLHLGSSEAKPILEAIDDYFSKYGDNIALYLRHRFANGSGNR